MKNMGQKTGSMKTKHKKTHAGLAAAVILTVLAAVYIGFAIFFQSHFCFGTTVNGIPVGGHNAGQVEKQIRDEMKTYTLTMSVREGEPETITGKSIDIAPVFDGEVQQMIKKQNGFLWIGKLFARDNLELEKVVSYKEEKLEQELSRLSFMKPENQRRPLDAACSDYTPSGGYELIPADYGTQIEPEIFQSAVRDAILVLREDLDLDAAGCYRMPKVLDDDADLLAMINQFNQYADVKITYEFGDEKELLDGEIIHTWLLEGENKTVEVDRDAVLEFVKDLGKKHNTAYYPKEFKTSYGPTITITGGFYGWRIDNSAETDQILADLEKGEDVSREPVYMQRANSHGEHDYGNSYVEINLTAQHLFLYKNGNLIVESDLVSGNMAKGHATPTGAFGLTYKTLDAVLRGADYATPVKYWMPFNGDVGMHDATWRGTFGGNIYKNGGSHGCINLPLSAAKTIYETIDQGYAVLVYTLPGTESKSAQQQEAEAVINAIHAIGPVTLESEPAIANARGLYNALSDGAKAYVSNYSTLVQAEGALAGLKNPEQLIDPNQQPDPNGAPQPDPNQQGDPNGAPQPDPNQQGDPNGAPQPDPNQQGDPNGTPQPDSGQLTDPNQQGDPNGTPQPDPGQLTDPNQTGDPNQ